MATTSAAAPPRKWWQVPRPLQKVFDTFPLLAYDVNALPARAQSATFGDLPTLYVFSTEEEALLGAPSFNPSCLKWQVRTLTRFLTDGQAAMFLTLFSYIK